MSELDTYKTSHAESGNVADRWPESANLATRAADRAREMLSTGATPDEILVMLVTTAEQVAESKAVCSILVVDRDGLLRNAASPNLPADYLSAIDRLKSNPRVGTCSAAAATGAVVVTCDFQADDKWAELRHLPLALGFAGAWSMPIKAADGRVPSSCTAMYSRLTGRASILGS